jgi:hypothetical protein
MVSLPRTPSEPPPILGLPRKFLATRLFSFLAAFSPLSSAGPFVSGSAYILFIPLSLLLPLLCVLGFFFFFFNKKNPPDVMHCRLWASPSCFFLLLVTFLSHRRHHLALAAVLHTRSSSSPSSAAYSVAWSGPAPGDRFGSGDTIVGEWQVTPQNQKVVSPSFRLCVGGEDSCGATIWPEVVEESEGSYYVSLYV